MNASAMVKHHQAVTAIMTQAMSDYASAATATWRITPAGRLALDKEKHA